jgi:glycosyltransferase involved in cell wall biosynthesis
VVYVIPSLEIGGAETQLVRLINGLHRDRVTPSVICLFGDGPLRAQLDGTVEVASLAPPNGRVSASNAIQLIRSMRAEVVRQKPDVVQAYLMPAYLLAAFAATKTPVRVLIASRRGLDTYRRRSSPVVRAAARFANRMIDFHLCNSEAVRAVVMADESLTPSKTGVIYNGIEPPAGGNPVELPAEWGLEENDGLVAMIANFNSYKRHADVIEATSLIVGRRPRFKLVLFGDGPEQGSIERLVSERYLERNVVLAGARLDAAELLSGFDLSVLASSKEGFPNALMESMARGVPVVATRVGGVPELVRDGQDGRLVDVARPDQLAAAILELLDAPDLRRGMGAAGSARVRELFSTETMVTRTENLYVELLSSQAR